MSQKVLVTGGAGFIGSHLVDALLTDYQVVVLDNFSTGRRANLPKHEQLIIIEGDVGNQETIKELFASHQFDYIFHLAAVASVMESITYPLATHQTNMDGTIYLLDAAESQQRRLKRFVFASSAAVYGAEPTLPKTEEASIQPLTPYAIDKFGSERYVSTYGELFNVPIAIARFFNVYGPRQNPSSPYSGVLSLLTKAFKKTNNPEFTIFGDGYQIRDFIYVSDVIQALELLAFTDEAKGGTYNIGTGTPLSLNDVIYNLEEITKKRIQLNYEAPRDGDILKSYATITKLEQLGFRVNMTIEEGLHACLKVEDESR